MKKTGIGIAVWIFCTTVFIGCRPHGSQRCLAFGVEHIGERLDLTAAQESNLARIKGPS